MAKFRKYIIILITLIIGIGIFLWIYNAHIYNDDLLDYDQLETSNLTLGSDGMFSGLFKCKIKGKEISKFDYEIENNNLYITVYASSSGESVLKADSKGFAKIKFFAAKDIKKVYYRTFEKETVMSVSK